ncbi:MULTISPECIES: 3-oxoacyl-[acyl-carrier-protein] synthase III C-terminal domain-containing protein [Thermomonosporaceae]|uniref:3-oxoacyl-[acyl-carrier-protein] synthase III C-terminal domain-containing protein n=1 Tax=Thermomonosporaceae TaxID=2012 RepID=UPI00255AE1CD|nr:MULTISPECIES: 3-oxoacyl-[acyl-carrier-protein] synthase III C-terminal domain-containing protein [Thermomonosporaceae]MDL4774213.1 3-oxoacyl-[acyl-carrier-protein] synthase III C-terminal domain-containing protein [Actinomadura xylanilytica]
MTSLEAVATYLPPGVVPIADMAEELGLSADELKVFRRFYGLSEVRREPEGTLTDLLLSAAGKLDALRGREHHVRYVVQARTMPVVVPHPVNPIHEVRDALGLRHAQAFALTHHACASGLLAVDLCGKLLRADGDPDGLALILTGEKTFTLAAQTVPGTAINGEGAAAVLVGIRGARDRMLGYAARTHGRFYECLSLTDALFTEFQRIYAGALAESMLAAVDTAGLTLDDIALVLPHNVNRVSWVRLAKSLGLPLDRVFLDNVPVTGHCFCADPFINYQTAVELGRLRPGDRYLLTTVGLGATFSAMVFEH